ncbi:hypothetical protein [Oleiagrimonas sp.]|jgi:hypothetical protein|uniref:hypothetical protein n=1 Tax=Oleiagrimonas sp. TaxID=2010330 RepID=UPI00263A018C|nr:hypothetical protein [Oleiagrimonas sp.]MDA3912565.1 hypothetical protein [Oleiagrimonas sp.]
MLIREGFRLDGNKTITKVARHPQGFYACLRQPTCGIWQKFYTKDHILVQVRLRGTEDDTGYIMMSFEEQPQFAEALEKNKQAALSKDAAAF